MAKDASWVLAISILLTFSPVLGNTSQELGAESFKREIAPTIVNEYDRAIRGNIWYGFPVCVCSHGWWDLLFYPYDLVPTTVLMLFLDRTERVWRHHGVTRGSTIFILYRLFIYVTYQSRDSTRLQWFATSLLYIFSLTRTIHCQQRDKFYPMLLNSQVVYNLFCASFDKLNIFLYVLVRS